MLGPTGKAAYIIKGNTIHSALAVPANQSLKNYKQLDSSRLNSLRTQFGGAKLIFVDEISIVGNSMFAIQINNGLKDIKGCKDDFGGVSVIAIGDLFQVEPVMDSYVFNFQQCQVAFNIGSTAVSEKPQPAPEKPQSAAPHGEDISSNQSVQFSKYFNC